ATLKRGTAEVGAILRVLPPVGDQLAGAAGRGPGVLRDIRPGVVCVKTWNRLKQCRRKVLAADVLNLVEQVVDAKVGRIDRRLRRGKQSEAIVPLSAVTGGLLGLGRLPGRGRRTKQLDLIAFSIQPRLDLAPTVGDVGTNALQRVAQPIELGVTQALPR